jgi:hypothetical protein
MSRREDHLQKSLQHARSLHALSSAAVETGEVLQPGQEDIVKAKRVSLSDETFEIIYCILY